MNWCSKVYPLEGATCCTLLLTLCLVSQGCQRNETADNRPGTRGSAESHTPARQNVQSQRDDDVKQKQLPGFELDDWKDKRVSGFEVTLDLVESDQDFIRIIHSQGGAYHGHNESSFYASNYNEHSGRRDTLYKIDKSAIQLADLKAAIRRLYQSYETAPPPEQAPSIEEFNLLLADERVVSDQSWEWGE